MTTTMYESGVWEQDRDFVPRDVFETEDEAEAAAIGYAAKRRMSGPSTGGPLSWAGGVRDDTGRTWWIDAEGRVLLETDPEGRVVQ